MGDWIIFRDDEAGYREWLLANPHGYVLNLRRSPTRGYAVLHRADCRTISTSRVTPGGFTERGYIKAYATDAAALSEYALALDLGMVEFSGSPDGFSKRCRLCGP